MSKTGNGKVPLLRDFIRDGFDFIGKNLAEANARGAKGNLELMGKLALMQSITELGKINDSIKPPKLLILDPKVMDSNNNTEEYFLKTAVAIITDNDQSDPSKTIEIFDPSLEDELTKLATEYKQKYSRPGFEVVINITVAPKPRSISL
jgi:hypothetical protein